jgi:hypothetical protein
MSTTGFAANYVIDVHLTLVCATDLAYASITIEHAFTLLSIASAVELV